MCHYSVSSLFQVIAWIREMVWTIFSYTERLINTVAEDGLAPFGTGISRSNTDIFIKTSHRWLVTREFVVNGDHRWILTRNTTPAPVPRPSSPAPRHAVPGPWPPAPVSRPPGPQPRPRPPAPAPGHWGHNLFDSFKFGRHFCKWICHLVSQNAVRIRKREFPVMRVWM